MSVFLSIIQIIISVLLIGAILMQAQGSGLSTSFGGGGEFYRSRQSIEKVLIGVTIFLGTIFGIISLVLLLFH